MKQNLTQAVRARMNKDGNDAGFSLVELLVVVLIIGVLSAIAIPIFLNQQNQAKDAAAKSDLANAKVAMVSYSVDNGSTFATATTSSLSNYGYIATSGVSLSVRTVSASAFCIQATSAAGNTFKVTESTGVTTGTCP